MALVLITHDMGVVAETAHRVQVMYAGQMVEEAPTDAAVRRAAPSLHRGAAGRAAGTRARTGSGCRPSPASCPASTTGRPAACSIRAAASPTEPVRDAAAGADARRDRPRALPLSACAGARRHDRADGGARPAPLLPRRRRPVRPQGHGARGRRRVVHARRRRNAGGGRRIGLRQIDAGAHGDADGAADRRRTADRRQADRTRCARRARTAAADRADGVPEPVRLAQSAQDRGRDPGGAAGDQPSRRRARAARRRRAR